jgi:hypothetical protein
MSYYPDDDMLKTVNYDVCIPLPIVHQNHTLIHSLILIHMHAIYINMQYTFSFYFLIIVESFDV